MNRITVDETYSTYRPKKACSCYCIFLKNFIYKKMKPNLFQNVKTLISFRTLLTANCNITWQVTAAIGLVRYN